MAIGLACPTCESRFQLPKPPKAKVVRCSECQTALLVKPTARKSRSLLGTLVIAAERRERRRLRGAMSRRWFTNGWQMLTVVFAATMCVFGLAVPASSLTSSLQGAGSLLGCSTLAAGAIMVALRSRAGQGLCATGAVLLSATAIAPLLSLLYGDGGVATKVAELPETLLNLASVCLPAAALLYCVSRPDWTSPHARVFARIETLLGKWPSPNR